MCFTKTSPTRNSMSAPNRLSEILNAVNRLYKKSVQSADMNLTFTLATASPDGEKTDQPGVEYISWPAAIR